VASCTLELVLQLFLEKVVKCGGKNCALGEANRGREERGRDFVVGGR
jgi:hypothetical protein